MGSADQAEQQETNRLAASAMRKFQAGQKPNSREMAAWKRYETAQREKYGLEFVAAIPKGQYVQWAGTQTKVLNEQADNYGFPLRGKSIDLPGLVRYLHEFLARNKYRLAAGGDPGESDPLLVGGTSPALERYRAARADISEDERDERRRLLLPRSAVHEVHLQWAGLLRSAAEKLQKRFGEEAREIMDQALDDCEAALETLFAPPDDFDDQTN